MRAIDAFSDSFTEAREKFLGAAREAKITVHTFEHHALGPSGETLSTDVTCLGNPRASKVLLLNSATHGVEGFCGSAALVDSLRRGLELPEAVRAVLVHAINPHGFAWLRRVTEDNVDLNRNFIDHSAPPANPDYEPIHRCLLPETLSDDGAGILAAVLPSAEGPAAVFAAQAALSRGQYAHDDGLFYGGTAPGWSNRTFRSIIEQFVGEAEHVGFIDFHTGLGPFGHAELISKCPPTTPEFERLRAWLGPAVKTSAAGESTSPMLSGLIANALRERLSGDRVSAVTAEYGTYPMAEVFATLVAENWVHHRGQGHTAQAQRIRARMREHFYPDDDDWRELVVVRARQLIRAVAVGLGEL